ncbi:15349_t:CDS:2, partial [Racocetra persica]
MATTLYTPFNEIFTTEIEKTNRTRTDSSKITPTIKNPLTKENIPELQESITSSITHVDPLYEIQDFNTETMYSQGSSSSSQYFVGSDFLSDELNL